MTGLGIFVRSTSSRRSRHVGFAPKADHRESKGDPLLSADFVAKVVDGPEEQ